MVNIMIMIFIACMASHTHNGVCSCTSMVQCTLELVHYSGRGVRGVEQWIRMATDYKIVVVPDTVGTLYIPRHWGHSTMHRVPPVSGSTTTMYVHAQV